MKRSPKCWRLQRVHIEGTNLDLDKWTKVKQEVLEGAFNSSPGGLVASTKFRVYNQEFKRASSIQAKYTLTDNSKMFLVQKDKWSQVELEVIATKSIYFGNNFLWMLPNMDKVVSLNEAVELSHFMRHLRSLRIDSEFLPNGDWETMGCLYNEEMTWTNPSLQRADMVVENLKKLCSELQIEFKEV